jgi:hypothetical protein
MLVAIGVHRLPAGVPRWSAAVLATGRLLVFENDTSGPKVFTAAVDGSGRRLLAIGYSPDWQAVRP